MRPGCQRVGAERPIQYKHLNVYNCFDLGERFGKIFLVTAAEWVCWGEGGSGGDWKKLRAGLDSYNGAINRAVTRKLKSICLPLIPLNQVIYASFASRAGNRSQSNAKYTITFWPRWLAAMSCFRGLSVTTAR